MESKWAMFEKVSSLLGRGEWTRYLFELLARSSYAPIIDIEESDFPDIREIYSDFRSKPVGICVFALIVPGRVRGSSSHHLCGLVANLSADNTFTYFDPHGDPGLSKPGVHEFVDGIFAKIKPAVLACQEKGLLLSTGKPLQWRGMAIEPIQRKQSQLFKKHGVKYFGLCATLTTLMLYEYQKQEGRFDLDTLSMVIHENLIPSLTDFARTVWNEAPEAIQAYDDPLLARLPNEKMQRLPARENSGTWSRHGFFYSEGSGWEDPHNVAESKNSANSSLAPRSGNKRQRQPLQNAYRTADAVAVSSNSNNGVSRDSNNNFRKNPKKWRFHDPGEENCTVQRSTVDVGSELEWLFTNTSPEYTLAVHFENAPNVKLVVVRVRGGNELKMRTQGGDDMPAIFSMNARELARTLELPYLTGSPLALFTRKAKLKSVTNTWDQVLWTRIAGFDQHNMYELWRA